MGIWYYYNSALDHRYNLFIICVSSEKCLNWHSKSFQIWALYVINTCSCFICARMKSFLHTSHKMRAIYSMKAIFALYDYHLSTLFLSSCRRPVLSDVHVKSPLQDVYKLITHHIYQLYYLTYIINDLQPIIHHLVL